MHRLKQHLYSSTSASVRTVWSCEACTFLNENKEAQLCEMCGTPRTALRNSRKSSSSGGGDEELNTILFQLREAIISAELTASTRNWIEDAVRTLVTDSSGGNGGTGGDNGGGGSRCRFAVRSSGSMEDLAEKSFAGQYDSILNVKPDDVCRAVKECWASQPRVCSRTWMGYSDPPLSVFSWGGTLLPYLYADARYIDAVLVSKASQWGDHVVPYLQSALQTVGVSSGGSAGVERSGGGGGGGGDGGANGGGGGGGGENGSGGDGSGVSDQITIAKMGVVIQLMVVPVSSGVIFTVDPRAVEQTTTMLVEAVHGLGEGIVSGEITPHSFSVDIATAAVRAQNKTKQMVKVSTNLDKEVSGIATVPTTETEQATPPISEAALLRLCCAGRAVAIHYGTPQDLVSTNTITNTITNTNKHKYKPVNHVRKRAHIADSYFATLTHRSSGRSR